MSREVLFPWDFRRLFDLSLSRLICDVEEAADAPEAPDTADDTEETLPETKYKPSS